MEDILINETGSLPALFTRSTLCLPNNEIKIEVGRDFSINAINTAYEKDNYIVLLVQTTDEEENLSTNSCLEYGVLAKIKIKVKLPNGNYKIKADGLVKVKVDAVLNDNKTYFVDYTKIHDFSSNAQEDEIALSVLKKEFAKNQEIFEKADYVSNILNFETSLPKIVDVLAFNLKNTIINKNRYLLELDITKRFSYILEDLKKEEYYQELENELMVKVKNNIDESQKEYYLREKLKVIQEELGDKAKKESEIEILREKILAKNMPKNIEEKALEELRKYEMTSTSSPDSANLRQYLDFVLSLPYTEYTEDKNDLVQAKKILDEGHFGLEKIKDRILEYLAVKMATGDNPQTILCLVGPPGVGKTSLAKSIAESLGRNYVRLAFGGVTDEAEIRGHRRTYIGALPGRILTQMKKAQTMNPLFLIDEIDKLGSQYKGDPSSAMLEVLDPEQNSKFMDHYFEEPYDLSKVLFIATANYLGSIPEPLRDRMEIIQLSSYTEIEKMSIAREHLISRQMDKHGLKADQFKIDDDALKLLINNYTREAGVRQLERVIATLCRKVVRKIFEETAKTVEITPKNLEEYLGKPIFSYSELDDDSQVGVVNGLAYTAFGGDTLQIEATYYEGKGGLILTGNLGDVMIESAKTALSYIKSKANEFDIPTDLFKNDIHIHVPEGATPKDGPSAGVTMTTALISALTSKKVRADIGMTGEITLRGKVLPIGGLREKSIAAHRKGLKKIFIPYENKNDIEDIPEIVKESLDIVLVKNIDDIIKEALI